MSNKSEPSNFRRIYEMAIILQRKIDDKQNIWMDVAAENKYFTSYEVSQHVLSLYMCIQLD